MQNCRVKDLIRSIRGLIRSMAKNPDDYGEKHMKIKFNSGNNLSLNKINKIIMTLDNNCQSCFS